MEHNSNGVLFNGLDKIVAYHIQWGKRPQKNSLVLKRFIALAEFVFESYSPTAKEKAYSILGDVGLTASILKTLKLT